METTPALHAAPAAHSGNPAASIRKLGFWIFLGSEFLIFLALIAVVALTRNVAKEWPTTAELGLWLVSVNTFVLLASSFTVASGIEAIRKNEVKKLLLYLALTLVLGVMFLLGQSVEYYNLIVKEGHGFADPFGTTFFMLTGLHGLHVLAGVFWCAAVILRTRALAYNAKDYDSVEIFGLYWHFVDVVWIFIFTIVYLLNP